MFYSFDEISVMSRSHGEDIRTNCRNCKMKKKTKKNRLDSLKLVAAAFISSRLVK